MEKRAGCEASRGGAVSVGGLARHDHVWLLVDDLADAAAKDGLVIRDQDAQRFVRALEEAK